MVNRMNKEKKKSETKENKKLQLAFYWAASCGGCEIAVLDINEKILDVIALADILFWPVAIDTKYKDVEAMEDNSVDVCFFNGAIRTTEQEHLAKLLRKKAKVLVAFGACAVNGGIPGLANVANCEEVFNVAYLNNPSTRKHR
jgi:F420-non-reducing hydrogenase small subunit